jgi:hypothetical protein
MGERRSLGLGSLADHGQARFGLNLAWGGWAFLGSGGLGPLASSD